MKFLSRAESSRVEPSWSTSILELKPSCIFFYLHRLFSLSITHHFTRKSVILIKNVLFNSEKTENKVTILMKMQEKYGKKVWVWKKPYFWFSSGFFFSELKAKGHEQSRTENHSLITSYSNIKVNHTSTMTMTFQNLSMPLEKKFEKTIDHVS